MNGKKYLKDFIEQNPNLNKRILSFGVHLYLAREIIERHKGSIVVESKKPAGIILSTGKKDQ